MYARHIEFSFDRECSQEEQCRYVAVTSFLSLRGVKSYILLVANKKLKKRRHESPVLSTHVRKAIEDPAKKPTSYFTITSPIPSQITASHPKRPMRSPKKPISYTVFPPSHL